MALPDGHEALIESVSKRLNPAAAGFFIACAKARLFSAQQTLQARRQVEALQKDMAMQKQAMEEAQVTRQRSRHMEEALKAVAEAEEAALAVRPNHGFADTQPMA